jgi:hypothetical protein
VRNGWAWLACAGLLLGACSATPRLTVDVKTDYLPTTEFVRVQTELSPTAFASAGASGTVRTDPVHASARYLDGVRVAELDGVVGDSWIRVSLQRADGAIVAQRTVSLHTDGNYALVVPLSRSCGGVTCPPAGGDAALSTCSGGECVDPRCGASAPTFCGHPQCRTPADCGVHGECGESACVDGVCLTAPSDALCTGGAACSADFHCAAAPDAGPVDAASPGNDTGPPACPCNDGNGCTDDSCATGTCVHTPNGAGCDDGDPCTHDDHCSGGSCGGTGYSCSAPACMTASCDGSGGCSIGGGCGGGTVCSGGSCVACGGADQTCCDSGGCNAGLWCYTGVCTCAQPGGPCCPWDNSCAGGSVCESGRCCMPGGSSCSGGCCSGLSCLSGYCL